MASNNNNNNNNNQQSTSVPQRVPKDWHSLLNLNKSEMAKKGVSENDLFITFQAWSAPQVKFLDKIIEGEQSYSTAQSVILGTYSFLHPSTGLNERIQHQYNSDASTFTTAMAGFGEKLVSVAAAWKTFSSNASQGAVYDVPVVWANTERREFNITLNLFAYTDLKADILDPIDFFRKNSYAEQSGQQKQPGLGGAIARRANYVNFPAVFKIWGGAFDTFTANRSSNLNIYNLMSMTTDFNESVKFMKEGVPMQAKVTLQFQECLKIYRNMFDVNDRKYTVTEAGQIFQGPTFKEIAPTPKDYTNFTKPSSINPQLKGKDYTQLTVATQGIEGLIRNTGLARLANNIQQRAIQTAITAVLKAIQGSELYKKVDSLINVDIQHQVELQQYLKQSKIYPTNSFHISNDVSPLTRNVAQKPDTTHIPVDILPLLKKTRG